MCVCVTVICVGGGRARGMRCTLDASAWQAERSAGDMCGPEVGRGLVHSCARIREWQSSVRLSCDPACMSPWPWNALLSFHGRNADPGAPGLCCGHHEHSADGTVANDHAWSGLAEKRAGSSGMDARASTATPTTGANAMMPLSFLSTFIAGSTACARGERGQLRGAPDAHVATLPWAEAGKWHKTYPHVALAILVDGGTELRGRRRVGLIGADGARAGDDRCLRRQAGDERLARGEREQQESESRESSHSSCVSRPRRCESEGSPKGRRAQHDVGIRALLH